MTLLNETINSFLPFNGEPWFSTNYDTQLAVLQLCWEGLAHLIVQSPEEETFTQHISHLIHTYVEKKGDFLVELVDEINNYGGDYLLSRSWFCKSSRRQVNVFLIKMHGYSHLINVVAPDFDEHIESIHEEILQDRQTVRDEVLTKKQCIQQCLPPLLYRDVSDEVCEIMAADANQSNQHNQRNQCNQLIRSHAITDDTINYGITYLTGIDGVVRPVYCDLDQFGDKE